MTTPEGKVKNGVRTILKKYNVYWHCPVQTGYGAPSLDFICCIPPHGTYLAIETKDDGKDLTPRQEDTKRLIETAGGMVVVIRGLKQVPLLETHLNLLGAKKNGLDQSS